MALENLNVPENIVIVLKLNDRIDGIPKGYVVDPSDDKSLEKARCWGDSYSREKAYGGSRHLEPLEYYTGNNNFRLSLFQCANSSSQGGKLSFWNCLIEKDDFKAVIGIDQTGLLSLLLQSTVINGVVQEGLSLSPSTSTAVAIHNKMEEWTKTKQYRLESNCGLKRTSKWKVGFTYNTVTKQEVYLGKLYRWFKEDHTDIREVYRNGRSQRVMQYYYKLLSVPEELENIVELDILKENYNPKRKSIKTLSELYNVLCNTAECCTIKESGYSSLLDIKLILTQFNILQKTLPRLDGGETLINDDKDNEHRRNYFKLIHSKFFELLSNGLSIYGSITELPIAFSSDACDIPVFTEENKNLILNSCSQNCHIDFGDGIWLTGRRD